MKNDEEFYTARISLENENAAEAESPDGEELAKAETGNGKKKRKGARKAKKKIKPEAVGIKSVDSVSAVSEYYQVRKRHYENKELGLKYLESSTENLLYTYHCKEGLPEEEKAWIRDEVFLRIYFLLPHSLREAYPVPTHTFNDAMQNMSFSVLQAIEKFDPTKGYTFVNYLAGYFKGAIAKTFRDTNVISIPTGRRRILKERKEVIKAEGFSNPDEVHSYNGIEYTENGWVGVSHIDFDENLHNKQLVEWLEEALSRDVDAVTSDERRVLILHYGLFGNARMPYREIAKLREQDGLGHAFSRLSQIHNKAIQKLRQFFVERSIEEY